MNVSRGPRLVVFIAVLALVAAPALSLRPLAASPSGEAAGGIGVDTEKAGAPAPAAPVPGGPGFYAQSAFAFSRYASGTDWAYDVEELWNPGTYEAAYEAPVSLPNGATVTRFVVYFVDTGPALDLASVMVRVALDGSGPQEMAAVESEGSPGYTHVEDTTIAYPVVDLQTYAYLVQVTLPPVNKVRLIGIRIDYAYQAKMPEVAKE